MATEFARRRAAKDVDNALEAVCKIPLTKENVSKLSKALRNWHERVKEHRRICADVNEEVIVVGES